MPALSAAAIGALTKAKVASEVAPAVGGFIQRHFTDLGKAKKGLLKEAVARSKDPSGYGLSDAVMNRGVETLSGPPPSTIGTVGGATTGPASGAVAAARFKQLREATSERAKARAKMQELSQAATTQQAADDKRLIQEGALDQEQVFKDTAAAISSAVEAKIEGDIAKKAKIAEMGQQNILDMKDDADKAEARE
jgi:hypothetical protein